MLAWFYFLICYRLLVLFAFAKQWALSTFVLIVELSFTKLSRQSKTINLWASKTIIKIVHSNRQHLNDCVRTYWNGLASTKDNDTAMYSKKIYYGFMRPDFPCTSIPKHFVCFVYFVHLSVQCFFMQIYGRKCFWTRVNRYLHNSFGTPVTGKCWTPSFVDCGGCMPWPMHIRCALNWATFGLVRCLRKFFELWVGCWDSLIKSQHTRKIRVYN